MTAPVDYLLGLGDDALIAAQRLGEWAAAAPEMEEDIALTNIALDQLGAARLLLSYAGELMTAAGLAPAAADGVPVSEDALAFLRDDREYRNCLLVELPNGDFGVTMAKLLFLSAYQLALYTALSAGPDARLAAIAAKARKESAYHFDHSRLWTVRLGDGTDESHRRMQAAVNEVWPYTHELFAPDRRRRPPGRPGRTPRRLPGRRWSRCWPRRRSTGRPTVGHQRAAATGVHTEHLSYLLAEMQVLHRAHPGSELVSMRRAHRRTRRRRNADRRRAGRRRAAAAVVDPEIRVLTIEELGVLREVTEDPTSGRITVTVTPTYTGCPAMDVIRQDIRAALAAIGRPDAEVRTSYAPAWSTDWISASGRAKLAPSASPHPDRYGATARSRSPSACAARAATRPTLSRSAGSAPPPARRSGAAGPAGNPSTT